MYPILPPIFVIEFLVILLIFFVLPLIMILRLYRMISNLTIVVRSYIKKLEYIESLKMKSLIGRELIYINIDFSTTIHDMKCHYKTITRWVRLYMFYPFALSSIIIQHIRFDAYIVLFVTFGIMSYVIAWSWLNKILEYIIRSIEYSSTIKRIKLNTIANELQPTTRS